MDNRKRYQIFVSSTFADLREERSRVIDTIFRFYCIPAGMQFIPAMDMDSFEYIKREIDDSDFHLLIIGGRYGSMDENGVSWTEREYDYAVSKGIPVLAFIHEDFTKLPASKTDLDNIKREKLIAFQNRVSKRRLIKKWSNADDLELAVASTLLQAFERTPRPGWVRTNLDVSIESKKEVERQKEYSTKLQNEINKLIENINGLELDLKKKNEDYHDLESLCQTSQEKIVKFQEEVEQLRTSQEDLERSYNKAKEEINILREERDSLRASQEINHNLEPSCIDAEKKIAQLEKEIGDVRALQKINQDLEKANHDAEKKIAQFEKEVGDVRTLQKINQDLEKANHDAQQKIAQLEKEVGDLNQIILELKQLNEDATKETQRLHSDIDELRENSNSTVLTEDNILKKISEAIKGGIESYLLKDKAVDESEPTITDDIPIPQSSHDNKKRVFISYRLKNENLNNKDEEVASKIQKALVDQGFECCMTSKELNEWTPRINKEISKCAVFILVLSKDSYNHYDTNLFTKPDNVVRALALAQRMGKAICVFRIDKLQPDETLMRFINPYLKSRTIDASKNYEEKIQDLIDRVCVIFNILNYE